MLDDTLMKTPTGWVPSSGGKGRVGSQRVTHGMCRHSNQGHIVHIGLPLCCADNSMGNETRDLPKALGTLNTCSIGKCL